MAGSNTGTSVLGVAYRAEVDLRIHPRTIAVYYSVEAIVVGT